MKLIFLLIVVVITTSCKTIQGPTHHGRSHNEQLRLNKKVIQREDARMKNAMKKARKKASKSKYVRKSNSKHKRKYI